MVKGLRGVGLEGSTIAEVFALLPRGAEGALPAEYFEEQYCGRNLTQLVHYVQD